MLVNVVQQLSELLRGELAVAVSVAESGESEGRAERAGMGWRRVRRALNGSFEAQQAGRQRPTHYAVTR